VLPLPWERAGERVGGGTIGALDEHRIAEFMGAIAALLQLGIGRA
jgi:hypothetical protein